MKPITITLQAFGSYGEKTTIDFRKASQNLFLITGDTGAGKTTIFDAIVYALYGENSSTANQKSNYDLQSQFAGYDVTPYVKFTFSETHGTKENVYTIYRQPRHIRQYKRGKGLTDEDKEVITLTMPDGRDYIGKPNEISKKIQEIVGLTKEQFMQVAMIAQGEFMQLLRTDSDKKRNIFRRLFGTEIFERLINELRLRNKNTQDELNDLLKRCQGRLEDLHLPTDLPADNPLPSLKARLQDSKQLPNIAELENLEQELQALNRQQQKDLQAIAGDWEKTGQQRDEINALLAKAQELAKSYEQLDRLLLQEKDLLAQETAQKENQQLGQNISAAYEIKALHDRLTDKENLILATWRQKNEQEEQLPQLQSAAQTAQTAEKSAQESAQKKLSAYTASKTKVDAALQQFALLESTQKQLAASKRQLTMAQKKQQETREAQEACARQISQWQLQVQELATVKSELAKKQGQQEKISLWEKEQQELLELERRTRTASQKAKAAQAGYLQHKQTYQQELAAFNTLQQQFLDAQAGVLAQSLHEGEPCPVCGSPVHPHPHQLAAGEELPSRDELDKMQLHVNELNNLQIKAATTSQQAQTKAQTLQQQFDEQLQGLCETLHTSAKLEIPEQAEALPFIQEQLEKWHRQITSKLQELTGKEQELEAIQAKLAQSGAESQRHQQEVDKATAAMQEADRNVQALSGKITALQNQQAYADKESALAELAQAQQQHELAAQELQSATQKTKAAQASLQTAQTIINDCTAKLPQLTTQKEELQTAYEKLCQQKALAPDDWQALTSSYPQVKAQELLKAHQEYLNDCNALHGQKKGLAATIGQQPRPDLEDISTRQSAINQTWQELNKRQQELRNMLEHNESIAKFLNKNLSLRQDRLGEAATIDSLYKRLSGNYKQSHMDIETFVQRYYLNTILQAANIRFREMSAGQFELRLIPLEKAGTGKSNHGLDLIIYSTVTGQERDIKTLSGGESFMAALSLALGISDQIQANTAAINLDIMFIDEGFGSLDDHARGQAIRVLKRLSGGDKLIGIISHVTELKQEIDNQLLVRKDDKGSHVQWQIS